MTETKADTEIVHVVTPADGETKTIDLNAGRRAFLRNVGLGAAGLTVMGAMGAGIRPARAQDEGEGEDNGGDDNIDDVVSDVAILNFALNLEYLEAEFYLRAAFGRGLRDQDTRGLERRGAVSGGSRVNFDTRTIRLYAEEIADDEEKHVQFLRSALGENAVARPQINIQRAFNLASRAAGLGNNFNPYENEVNFLLAAFIFEDVGVTAYRGAAPLIEDPAILSAAAGILGTEAYHAGLVRTILTSLDLFVPANQISNARDSLDGDGSRDAGIGTRGRSNIVPGDANALVYGRTVAQVLDVVYLGEGDRQGGFFPRGINGDFSRLG